MNRNKLLMTLIGGTALLLAGCGSDPGGRALSGGLIGAGAGAAIGAATGGNPATGAISAARLARSAVPRPARVTWT